jgi:hypothetical protein
MFTFLPAFCRQPYEIEFHIIFQMVVIMLMIVFVTQSDDGTGEQTRPHRIPPNTGQLQIADTSWQCSIAAAQQMSVMRKML